MGRRRIRAAELDAFVRELESSGASGVQVRDAGVDGWHTVWWDDADAPAAAAADTPAKLYRWSFILVLLGLTLAVFFLSFLFGGLFGSLKG